MRRTHHGRYARAALLAGLATLAAAGCSKLNRNQQNAEQSGGTNAPMQTGAADHAAGDSAIPLPHGAAAPLDSDSVRSRAGGGVGGKGDETQERAGTGTTQNVVPGGRAANTQPTAAAPR
jgi:hypothetical protein